MAKKFITGHLHTIIGNFIPVEKITSTREKHIIDLPDGDRLVGFLYRGTSNIVVSLYHGLSGNADADYMHRTAKQFLALGHTVFLTNHRGVGEGAGMAQYPYHSGRAEDISQVIKYLRDLLPNKKQIATGFSMSGNIILYLISGQRGEYLPDAAMTVNAPINLLKCSEALNTGFNKLYDMRFVRRLKKYVKDLELPPKASMLDIDDLYTAPRSGFKNGREYYNTCSAKTYVHKIKIPTCVMTSEDDPFVDVADYREAKWSSSVDLRIHAEGGHMGYVSPLKTQYGSNCHLDGYLVRGLNDLIARL